MKSWEVYAHHILDVGEKIQRIQGRGDLTQDELVYDATLRNLQTLSEATQMIPAEMKAQFPDIPWREIVGFRNILVHNYLGDIDALTVQRVIHQHLPPLMLCVRHMLDNSGTTKI